MIERILIVGTGLIGASTGLALRAAGFTGQIAGFDASAAELEAALASGAIDSFVRSRDEAIATAKQADVILLAVPVLAILDWMRLLAPELGRHQLVTDTGSTKRAIADQAQAHYNSPAGARCLPGHPMAGKESGGAALAEASLFQGAMWLFTPVAEETSIEAEWRAWVSRFGTRSMDLDPARHDQVCAWVSHLPQMVATAMSAMFEEEFSHTPELAAEFQAIGGRALREMTRLGASPYSMWRDVAMTNTQPLAATIYALEQRLAHLREGLKTPELREEFRLANEFRARRD
ncbi:prephenate dehydrogenase [Granulicella rosea]|uniref:Prephenate dehydrogenase n=1 Tax=Granulicella rosea TaxID=474952 RepID=A0A239LLZ5_9BACT|nr:prephenate dehydrogenase/arogenate dehydrogenase family protein [Granulicella rosea]SNT30898.1 prephenate dehydrogenase [Granulicella rosea]